ncbi:hypothetical protein DNTS_033320 [Danionella cerebrum]|uniref:non-specific serine/threonine protein kinase n=1 Tax=Danionella cerebrum TaxID=2873325 RepID=A0A553PUX5_9TELE|nr:hypothetical protein DNTS_033320 [Danionella translucida]
MEPRRKNGPVFIKTYSKHVRKVDPWFLPEQRKAVFSFSNTSSDQSVLEVAQPKKRKIKKDSHTVKSMTAIKENESDAENHAPFRKKRKVKAAVRTTASRKTRSSKRAKVNAQFLFSSSENEDDSILAKKLRAKTSNHECAGVKQSVLQRTLNSSDDFIVPISQNKLRDGTKSKSCSAQNRVSLAEVSFNDSDDQHLQSKCPLLSSTPAVVCRRLQILPEHSISEISLSFEEPHQPMVNDHISISDQNHRDLSSERGIPKESEQDLAEEIRASQPVTEGSAEFFSSSQGRCASPKSTLQSLVEQLKGRCQKVDVSVTVKRTRISKRHLPLQSSSTKQEKVSTESLESSLLPSPTCSPASNPSLISSPNIRKAEFCSKQALVDHLKADCLSSSLMVSIPRLDLALYPSVHLKVMEARSTDSPDTDHGDSPTSSSLKESGNILAVAPINIRTPSNPQTEAEHLSTSFQTHATSAQSRNHSLTAIKERSAAVLGTGRKVCVSGLSVSRWSKRGTGEFKEKRKKEGQSKAFSGVNTPSGTMMSAGVDSITGESLCGWLQGTSGIGLSVTPLRMEQLNLSSILANMTPDALTTHSWGRLKAALSLHKKKTAFPTPQRVKHLVMSPGYESAVDNSSDLFASPFRTPSRSRPSRLLQSINKTPMISYEEDISDAEKVYQECQQSGPVSFSDCIPASRIKHLTKIGEGTFGEVFSIINDSNDTVALKIIPVEGSQQVNGEEQKTFGEILHEIIISKELSSLNTKEFNKTDGFIGLNKTLLFLVCIVFVDVILKLCSKLGTSLTVRRDQRMTDLVSDINKPPFVCCILVKLWSVIGFTDFFGDEQMFLILEFEFGGSDLENMNAKLSSMVQAKSVLHQVTAALAVAEQSMCFEHRDLHWGNVLVKSVKEKDKKFILNGTEYSIKTQGVHVNIIDYSLSRLEIGNVASDGLTVSCDISSDEQLFMGQGDYQFEVYRLMKKENNNCWSEYNPHSNVLWLHYLADKLLSMTYKTKAQSNQQKTAKKSLNAFKSEILSYASASEALSKCSLFQ